MTVKIKKIHPKARTPQYKTEGSSGCDLHSVEDCTVKSGSVQMIKTGFAIQMPRGYEAQVRSRSGLALKSQVFVMNSPGTIDNDYRGEVCVILANFSGNDFVVKVGDRIAQMVFARYEQLEFQDEEESLNETDRGTGGFGSTGV